MFACLRLRVRVSFRVRVRVRLCEIFYNSIFNWHLHHTPTYPCGVHIRVGCMHSRALIEFSVHLSDIRP